MGLLKHIDTVKTIASFGTYWLGIYSLCRRISARSKVTCVFFHDIVHTSPLPGSSLFIERDFFWQHIGELSKNYSIVGMSDLLSGDRLPPYPLVISFDGYSHRYVELAEQLSERRIKALFYLQTEPIATGLPHWRQRLYFVFRDLKNVPVNTKLGGRSFSADLGNDPRENRRMVGNLAEHMEPVDDKNEVVSQIAACHQVDLEGFDWSYRPLVPREVAKLSGLSGIEVGSHSHTHTFSEYLDSDRCLADLRMSKELLESWADTPVLHYAYPSGWTNEVMRELVPRAGYLTAATAGAKLHQPYSSPEWPYLIPRFGAPSGPFYLLAGRLAGCDETVDRLTSRVREMLRGPVETKGEVADRRQGEEYPGGWSS